MKKYIFTIAILFLGIYGVSYCLFIRSQTRSDLLRVSLLDIGQGDAIYIRAPNGYDVLIDGGPDDAVVRKLREVMPIFDNDIDLMIATHPDKDHIAGLSYIFDIYRVRAFMYTEVPATTSFSRNLQKKVGQEKGLNFFFARKGQHIVLDARYNISLEVLFPPESTIDFKETNAASVVTRLHYHDISFLLTGDAPESTEKLLVTTMKDNLRSTVLKLGHHGSRTSTSETFIDAVQPSLALVSAGKDNSYGHPNKDVVKRLEERIIPIISTIEQGTIRIETNGERLWVK